MVSEVLTLLVAYQGGARVPLDPLKGPERLSIAVPNGFFLVGRTRGRLVLSRQHAQIIVEWTQGKVSDALRKAMKQSEQSYRTKGTVMGTLKIGPYSGPVLRILFNQGKLGIDLHAPMVSGHDLLGVTYYDASADVHTTQRAAQLLVDMSKNSRYMKL